MSRIRILTDQVANQIAAGEVVERPVGAVKELLENSLDAGATKVEVEFRKGGKGYLRVEDDGCGMSPDEALLSLERHATSKLRNAKDLEKVVSFGFRGEALPSIASVSQFTMCTRPHDQAEGSEIRIHGGKILHQKTSGMPPGTRIEASNLFFNVPARKKFLKTENTEAAHISRLCRLYAIAHPEVAFTTFSNQRKVFQSPACKDLHERIGEVFGSEVAEHLVHIGPMQEDGCRIHGRVSPPGIGRPTRQDIVTVVNGRPVESRTLLYALTEAYHTLIPKGKYPAAFLFVEIDPALIDVNIHPQKREIRFRSEGHVRRLLVESILKMAETLPAASRAIDADRFDNKPQAHKPTPIIPEAKAAEKTTSSFSDAIVQKASTGKPELKIDIPIPDPTSLEPSKPVGEKFDAPLHANSEWHYISKLRQNIALFDTPSGLVFLHIPAARERIRFEEILRYHAKEGVVIKQELLLPVPVQLDSLGTELLEKNRDILEAEGFGLEEFGRDFYRIDAIPAWLDSGEAEDLLRKFLETARTSGARLSKPELVREAIAKIAINEILQAQETIPEQELAEIPSRLLRCQYPMICPKGKATFFEVDNQELIRRFGRNIA